MQITARYLYDRMPGAPKTPEDENGVKLWGEVTDNEHYQFCEAIARSIALVDVRVHVEAD